MLRDPEIDRGLDQDLDRGEAALEDKLPESLLAMLLEQAADEGVDERAVGTPDAREVQNHLLAQRQIGVDLRDTILVGLGTVGEPRAEVCGKPEFVFHGSKVAEPAARCNECSKSLALSSFESKSGASERRKEIAVGPD